MAEANYITEEWRDVPGFEGLYQVSDQGSVRSLRRTVSHPHFLTGQTVTRTYKGKRIATSKTGNGYLFFSAAKNGIYTHLTVHRVVCWAFHGAPSPEQPQAAHLNGIRIDNRASNLVWASQKENEGHKAIHGLDRSGEANNWAKLKIDEVRDIRAEHAAGATMYRIAKDHGVTSGCVRRIILRQTWARVP